jgi:hypothetical protein
MKRPTLTEPPRKSPVIRRGETKPYVKPTNAELARRIETVARLLGDKQATRTEIHDYCARNYGVVWQTAETYTRRAREFLLQRAGKTKDTVLGEAVVFYEGVLRAEQRRVIVKEGGEPRVTGTTVGEKLVARDKLNELFGIYPPRRAEVSGPEGAPVQVAATAPMSAQLIERLRYAYKEKVKRDVRRELREEARAKAEAAKAAAAATDPNPTPAPSSGGAPAAAEPAEPEPPKGKPDVLV